MLMFSRFEIFYLLSTYQVKIFSCKNESDDAGRDVESDGVAPEGLVELTQGRELSWWRTPGLEKLASFYSHSLSHFLLSPCILGMLRLKVHG